MIETPAAIADPASVETVIAQELARGDVAAETVIPILRHLLANDGGSVFSDDILARVRSMTEDLVEQLLPAGADEDDEALDDRRAQLAAALHENAAFLAHIHGLAMEWKLTERLQSRFSLDPVVSPLLQALIASSEADVQALAMKTLAAQARFGQAQRRMSLALEELPGDHLHFALVCMRNVIGEAQDEGESVAREAEIRARYDESATRLGMLSRLVSGMGSGAVAALSVSHAGVALFLTALAIGSGQDRDGAVLATNEGQLARLALSLRSAGLKPQGIVEQFASLHPEVTLPAGFEHMGADRAAAILAAGGTYPGG